MPAVSRIRKQRGEPSAPHSPCAMPPGALLSELPGFPRSAETPGSTDADTQSGPGGAVRSAFDKSPFTKIGEKIDVLVTARSASASVKIPPVRPDFMVVSRQIDGCDAAGA